MGQDRPLAQNTGMWLQLRNDFKSASPALQREAATLREKELPWATQVSMRLLVHIIHPFLQSLGLFSFFWKIHTRYSKQNATKEVMQELQDSSWSSWGFEDLLGKSSLSKRKFSSPEAIADQCPSVSILTIISQESPRVHGKGPF